MSTKTDVFKGHKILCLYDEGTEGLGDRPAMSFGKRKAKLVLENFDAIKEFAEEVE